MTIHHVLGAAAGLVVVFVLAKSFFGSLWRSPPKRDDYTPTDWSGQSEVTHHSASDLMGPG